MRLLDRLHAETLVLYEAADTEATILLEGLLDAPTPRDYRRYLARTFGFVAPLERALRETAAQVPCLDERRLRKHQLLSQDLVASGLGAGELAALPHCPSIPRLGDLCQALGWEYALERPTLRHAQLYRSLATMLPGEVAFASAYLKDYIGACGRTWQALTAALELVGDAPADAERIVWAAQDAFRHQRRWLEALESGEAGTSRARRASSSGSLRHAQCAVAVVDDS